MPSTSPPSVRSAHARLAVLKRHRAHDDPEVLRAKRDLVVAQAAALAAEAARLLTGKAEK